MGNFYTNFTLKTSDAADVADTLEQGSRPAFVTPARNGWVVVFDAEADSQDIGTIEFVGEMLSKQQKCPVLAALNHDDDILCYWLFDRGKLIDSYNSAPDYFGDTTGSDRGGDAELLCKTLGKPASLAQVRSALYGDDYDLALLRHQALWEALGLPAWAVGSGYRSLEEGEFPDGLSEDDVHRVE